jgi:hypothetical protein
LGSSSRIVDGALGRSVPKPQDVAIKPHYVVGATRSTL